MTSLINILWQDKCDCNNLSEKVFANAQEFLERFPKDYKIELSHRGFFFTLKNQMYILELYISEDTHFTIEKRDNFRRCMDIIVTHSAYGFIDFYAVKGAIDKYFI